MLIFMDNSVQKEHLFQTLPTNEKQFEMNVLFKIGFKGIFKVTNKNKNTNFCFKVSNKDDNINRITISPGA